MKDETIKIKMNTTQEQKATKLTEQIKASINNIEEDIDAEVYNDMLYQLQVFLYEKAYEVEPKDFKKSFMTPKTYPLGTPKTIGELKSIIIRYPNETSFGFRNQHIQSLVEVQYDTEKFVCFQL